MQSIRTLLFMNCGICGVFYPSNKTDSVYENVHNPSENVYEENSVDLVNKTKSNIKNDTDDLISWNNTIMFVPPIYGGKVIKVYDGDTITIASKLPYNESPYYRFSVRLRGIDCPEIKGKTPKEKELACKARDALKNEILNKWIVLEDRNNDKYGRLLANVYYDGKNMSQWMLENNYAVSYDGGTKHIPEDWSK